MLYGIRDGCLRVGWEEAFKQATELGFDGLELDVGADYQDTPLWTAAGRKQVAEWAKRGAELSSVCIGALWSHSFGSSAPAVRARAHEVAYNTIDACAELSANWILVPVTPGQDAEEEQARQHWIDGMIDCAERAVRDRVVLCLENVGRGYAQSAVDLLEIARAVDSPFLRTYYDPGNGLSLGNDPVAELALLGQEWIAVLHAKDPGGDYLGEGDLDWDGVEEKVKEIGYDGYMILETPATDDPVEAGRRNLAFLKERFG